MTARQLRELAEALLVAVLLAGFARTFLAQPFRIPSVSMAPALLAGDHVIVNRFVFAPSLYAWERRWLPLREPARGDVAVFRYPRDPRKPFVKRVLGVAGERVELRRGALSVGGKVVDERAYARRTDPRGYPASSRRDPFYMRRHSYGPDTVPAASLFVLGDNRELSADSRYWGYVPRRFVLGRALVVYWSLQPASAPARPRWERIGRLAR